MSAIPGPVETLARLAIQSYWYTDNEEFRNAVDAVIGVPVFDAAPDLLEALKSMLLQFGVRGGDGPSQQARAAIAKATGSAA